LAASGHVAHVTHHHLGQHALPAAPGGAWYVRALGSFSHVSVGWLLGRVWLPMGLLAAVAVAVLVGRVWGRHRLAGAGSWWELHLGEQVSRGALEAFTRTLAGGLPRRLFGASPWVALSVSSLEDRARCGLFISGGLSPAQVRASVEQALGSVTVAAEGAMVAAAADGGVWLRVASLAPVGSRFLPLRVDHGVDPAGQLLASLRVQEAGEGGVVQLVLQAPPRSASAKARSQAARLRSSHGLQPSVSLRALGAVASLLGEMLDMFTPGSPRRVSRPAPARSTDPFSLERARAIDAKASTPLLAATLRVGAWARGRRRARGRLGGLLAALGQYRELGGLHRSWEPFCAARLARCLPPVKPRLLLGSAEAAVLIAVPEASAIAPLSFSEAPSRRVAPVGQAPTCGLLLGRSDHAGFDREVRVQPKALLQHTHVLGPTGRGKSTQAQLSERLANAAMRLRQPCLLVRGAESDVLTASIAREFIELAANATRAEVPHAGHMVAGDNNNAFTAAIRAWLDTLAARTSPMRALTPGAPPKGRERTAYAAACTDQSR
jgi:hypothetical protein